MTDQLYTAGYKYFSNYIWDNKRLLLHFDKIYVCNKAMKDTTEYLIDIHGCSSLQAIVTATEIKNNWLHNNKEMYNIPW